MQPIQRNDQCPAEGGIAGGLSACTMQACIAASRTLMVAGNDDLCIVKISIGKGGGGAMSTVQAFMLGMMVAWTPSLVIVAWLLRDAPLGVSVES